MKRSITFHPQTYGHIEVVNRKIIQLLQGYYGKHAKTRDEYLIYIQNSYNKEIHTSISKNSFETYFGYLPLSPFDYDFVQQKDK